MKQGEQEPESALIATRSDILSTTVNKTKLDEESQRI